MRTTKIRLKVTPKARKFTPMQPEEKPINVHETFAKICILKQQGEHTLYHEVAYFSLTSETSSARAARYIAFLGNECNREVRVFRITQEETMHMLEQQFRVAKLPKHNVCILDAPYAHAKAFSAYKSLIRIARSKLRNK